MKRHYLRILVPAVVTAAALALALGVVAQTPTPAAKSPQRGMMHGHHKGGMMAECQAMMAKKQEMQEKLQAMDATLDKLVVDMNTALAEHKVDVMEKPMAAVINEVVAQRKAMRSMMMEMEPAMMAHMMRHMRSHDTKGAMQSMSDCPMMKMDGQQGRTPQLKEEEKEKPH
jgi:hypothetical protein